MKAIDRRLAAVESRQRARIHALIGEVHAHWQATGAIADEAALECCALGRLRPYWDADPRMVQSVIEAFGATPT